MIYHPLSQHIRSTEYPLAAGAVISADGQALVGSNVNGAFGVGPATGQAGEVFVGFVLTQTSAAPFLEQTAVKVEKQVVPASGTITLSFAPLASSTSVIDTTTGAAVSSPTVSGHTVSGLTAGDAVTVTYAYALTVSQAIGLMGNAIPSGYAGSLLGSVGCSQGGKIYTSQFDASKNWAAATGVKLAANGQLTDQTGSGVAISALIVAIPNQDIPFLGIEFNAV